MHSSNFSSLGELKQLLEDLNQTYMPMRAKLMGELAEPAPVGPIAAQNIRRSLSPGVSSTPLGVVVRSCPYYVMKGVHCFVQRGLSAVQSPSSAHGTSVTGESIVCYIPIYIIILKIFTQLLKRSPGTNVSSTSTGMGYLKDRTRNLHKILQNKVGIIFGSKILGRLHFYDDASLEAVSPSEVKKQRFLVISVITKMLTRELNAGEQQGAINLQELADVAAALHAQKLHEQALPINQSICKQAKVRVNEKMKGSQEIYGPALWNLSISEGLCGNLTESFMAMWECYVWICLEPNKKLSVKHMLVLLDKLKAFTCSAVHKNDVQGDDHLKPPVVQATQVLQDHIREKTIVEESLWHMVHMVLYLLIENQDMGIV